MTDTQERTIEQIREMSREEAKDFYITAWGATEAEAEEMARFSHGRVAHDVRTTAPVQVGEGERAK